MPTQTRPRRRRTAPSPAREYIALRRVPTLDGLDLLRARFAAPTPLHTHPEFEIGVVVSGARGVWSGDEYRFAPAGSVVVFNPGVPHAGIPIEQGSSTYRSFLVPASTLAAAAARCAARPAAPWFASALIRDERLAALLAEAHAEFDQECPSPAAEALLASGLCDLVRRHAEDTPRPEETGSEAIAVRRVRHYLEEHFAERIRLSRLSELAGMNVFRLIRVFRAATGLPPHAYLEQLRIGHAATMLRTGCPVSTVAFRTGFSDQSHLTRFFKRVIGVPPGQYRRSALEGGWVGRAS